MKKIFTLFILSLLAFSSKADFRVDTVLDYNFAIGSTTKVLNARRINSYNASNALIQSDRQQYSSGSSSFINNDRTIYTYDGAGNILVKEVLYWSASANDWIGDFKMTYVFTTSNQLSSELKEYWETSTNSWSPATRYYYSFNAANSLLSYVYSTYLSTNTWRNDTMYSATLDANNNPIEEIVMTYSAPAGTIVFTTKNINTYNAANLLSQKIKQTWDGSTWQNSARLTYTYNAAGLLTLAGEQLMLGVWTNSKKTSYTYNSADSPTYTETSTWGILSNTWKLYSRILYNYNTDYQQTLQQNERMSTDATPVWVYYSKITNEYDGDKNLVASDEFDNWSASLNVYQFHTRSEFICAAGSTSIANGAEPTAVSIFPNPVTQQQITIIVNSKNEYKISSIDGQIVRSGLLEKGENKLELGRLSAGIYFIKIGTEFRKIIIQ